MSIGESRLPTEIVDQVLRQLDARDDRHILCDCALVSHTWLALSRTMLFSSIFITPYRISPNNDTRLKAFRSATIRPYVREITVGVDPTAEWTQTYLPKLLAQFPELATLRLTENWGLLIQWQVYTELELFINSYVPPPRCGLVAWLRRVVTLPRFMSRKIATKAQPIVTEEESDDGFFTVHQRAPLALLRTVHIRYPEFNVPILALLAPPVLDTVHLTLKVSATASEALHACLRAAGPGLRALVLHFWQDSPITQLATRLTTGLRTIHIRASDLPVLTYAGAPIPCSADTLISIATRLLGCVLDAPQLEELIIGAELEYGDVGGTWERMTQRAELDRVLRTLPNLRTVRIPSSTPG
ncbi:hypothetical protein DFH08DRAFT_497358 [Mycena albidolilacea]|uniref:F-box domain-containing protein n=1 Tax=Mycena albidolilacea TaxID=1033008 RepID=A0AAD7EW25_9AGAR|nr:hypothetical protein DFH08DRAFT_497358 [Mycena albidolilacea]